MLLNHLFETVVKVGEMDPAEANVDVLHELERSAVATSVEKRKREFAAGRILARLLLSSYGVSPDFALLNGTDRAPCWPPHLIGSITHTEGKVAVAVAPLGDIQGIGIDIECKDQILPSMRESICRPAELRWALSQTGLDPAIVFELIFSAKESVYKAQYPLSKCFLDHHDLELQFDVMKSSFAAQLKCLALPFQVGMTFMGRFIVGRNHVATAVIIKKEQLIVA